MVNLFANLIVIKNNQLYNKSSESMSEISDGVVDLVIAGPPYNIGTLYENYTDLLPLEEYRNLLTNIFTECRRVLKEDGVLVIEASDTVYSNGQYIQLAGMIQKICLDIGFFLKSRHINFVKSDNYVETPDHDWKSDYTTKNNAHSNCHQWLVFTKKNIPWENGEIFYFDYESAEGHPCPFPVGACNVLLSKYFKEGNTVLDPFSGTARLGEEVLKRGGKYIGYEINKKYFDFAQNRLNKLEL